MPRRPGAAHPGTLVAMGNLLAIRRAQGDGDGARQLAEPWWPGSARHSARIDPTR